MEDEVVEFGNPEIEEVAAVANGDVVEAEAFGGHHVLHDALDDVMEADEEDFDDLEAELINRFHNIFEVDIRLFNPDVTAVGRVDALFRDASALLEANAAHLDEARLNLDDARRRAAAVDATPVLPGTEEEALAARARARARQALEDARLDVVDLAEHRWMLLLFVLGVVFLRALAVTATRVRLLPPVLLAILAAKFIVAYASNGAHVAGATSSYTRAAILTALWFFGY